MTVECRKCSMNENCICIPSADECLIRKESYNKAIDDFRKKICEKYTEDERKGNYSQYCCNIKQELADLAERLKSKTEC